MSNINQNTESQPESNRNVQISINLYANRNNYQIQHIRYVDHQKSQENIRILNLNPQRINPWNNYKMQMLLESCEKYKVDVLLLNKTQVKWNPSNLDKMEQRMKILGREAKIFGNDSNQWDVTRNDYLPGEIISIFLGKRRVLIKDDKVTKGRMGNWMAIKCHHKDKTFAIINIYRIPITSSNGTKCSVTQCNLSEGKTKSPSSYRLEILQCHQSRL